MKLTIEIVSSFLNTTFKNIQILRLTRTIQIYLFNYRTYLPINL